jgi:signal transduction histidine kinase
MFSAITAGWGLSLFVVSSTSVYSVALIAQYILDIFAVLTLVSFLHFVRHLLPIKVEKILYIVDLISALVVLVSFMPIFKTGVVFNTQLESYWVNPGPLYIILPIYFFIIGIFILVVLIKSYIHNKSTNIVKDRIQQLIFAFIFGSLGGATNFLPQLLGINLGAFGNIFMLTYVFFMSFAVLKYNLFNTKVIATRLFSGAILLVLLTNILRSNSLSSWGLNLIMFIIVGVVSILLSKSVFIEVQSREKVEKLAKRLKKLNKRLKVLDERKNEFLHIATHQLRGPITAINGYASLIKEGDYGQVSKKLHEPIANILSASKVMSETINDYMNIARIEEDNVVQNQTEFDLCKLVEERSEVRRINATDKGIDFKLENNVPGDKCVVRADNNNITQVLNALLENAIKYTHKGGVVVTTELVKSGKSVRVSINDTGIGVAKEEVAKLFDKFTRADNAKETDAFGTGMGLFIAKNLIEANGGSIYVDSDGIDKGTTFTIELPVVA